jgi:hypothetical protein
MWNCLASWVAGVNGGRPFRRRPHLELDVVSDGQHTDRRVPVGADAAAGQPNRHSGGKQGADTGVCVDKSTKGEE